MTLTSIYLIPQRVPCPNCSVTEKVSKITLETLSNIPTNERSYTCNICGINSPIKDWLNGFVAMIKDVEV